jgi:hypothetical protein
MSFAWRSPASAIGHDLIVVAVDNQCRDVDGEGLDTLVRGLEANRIAWTLANPAVQVAIVGTRNPKHIDEAMAAAEIEIDPGLERRMSEAMSSQVTKPIAMPRTALLGTGIMGAGMAERLLDLGFTVDVWDRKPSATAQFAKRGAIA